MKINENIGFSKHCYALIILSNPETTVKKQKRGKKYPKQCKIT